MSDPRDGPTHLHPPPPTGPYHPATQPGGPTSPLTPPGGPPVLPACPPARLPACPPRYKGLLLGLCLASVVGSPAVGQDSIPPIDQGVRIGITYAPGVRPGMLVLGGEGSTALDSARTIITRDLEYGLPNGENSDMNFQFAKASELRFLAARRLGSPEPKIKSPKWSARIANLQLSR